jgi:hypothetical protein
VRQPRASYAPSSTTRAERRQAGGTVLCTVSLSLHRNLPAVMSRSAGGGESAGSAEQPAMKTPPCRRRSGGGRLSSINATSVRAKGDIVIRIVWATVRII